MELAKTQPLLVGGVGTAGLYVVRSIPGQIVDAISKSLVSTLVVDNFNDYYFNINLLVSKNKLSWTFRNYEPAFREDDFYGESIEKRDFLIPGYGKGWGIWNGTVFSFFKEREDKGQQLLKKLTIRLYTRNEKKMSKFFAEAVNLQAGDPVQRIYVSESGRWSRGGDKKPRELSTVFINNHIKENLVEKVDKFLLDEEWYLQRGIPYKLCIMLYGVPGTGKTSLIHALASHFGLDINYVTKLSGIDQLISNNSTRKSIIVIEDIDALSSSLQREDDKSTTDLHSLLNSLDGFTTKHGMIIVMTSNYPERLDKALVRPGRIDLALEIGPLDFDSMASMFKTFYGECLDYGCKDNYTPLVGAELQHIFMQNACSQTQQMLGLTTKQANSKPAGYPET